MHRYDSTKILSEYTEKIEINWLKRIGFLTGEQRRTVVEWNRIWSDPFRVYFETGAINDSSPYNPFNQHLLRNDYLRLVYRLPDGVHDYSISITTMYCNYGGFRYWFSCPGCGRRVGVLYLRSGLFTCRHCSNIVYESQRIGGRQKAVGRIISIPELKECEDKVKRPYYAGKTTRKYRSYLRLVMKARNAYRTAVINSLPKGVSISDFA